MNSDLAAFEPAAFDPVLVGIVDGAALLGTDPLISDGRRRYGLCLQYAYVVSAAVRRRPALGELHFAEDGVAGDFVVVARVMENSAIAAVVGYGIDSNQTFATAHGHRLTGKMPWRNQLGATLES